MPPARTTPQIIAAVALTLGLAIFAVTLFFIDWTETRATAARLGPLLPLVFAPSTAWHLLRTTGFLISFPREHRPGFVRLFRVRLAADGVAYFTIRGVASEPLRVLLLLDRVPAPVATAASTLERLSFGIMGMVIGGIISVWAMQHPDLARGWQGVFGAIAGSALLLVTLLALLMTKQGEYIEPLMTRLHRRTGWAWTSGRVTRFILAVEDQLLALVRGDAKRLWGLVGLALVCYGLMALEVVLVFWAVGQPIALLQVLAIETFSRTMSLPGGLIPAGLGTMEASNVAIVAAFAAGGAGSLALLRRVRSFLWAALGLFLAPRDVLRSHVASPQAFDPGAALASLDR